MRKPSNPAGNCSGARWKLCQAGNKITSVIPMNSSPSRGKRSVISRPIIPDTGMGMVWKSVVVPEDVQSETHSTLSTHTSTCCSLPWSPWYSAASYATKRREGCALGALNTHKTLAHASPRGAAPNNNIVFFTKSLRDRCVPEGACRAIAHLEYKKTLPTHTSAHATDFIDTSGANVNAYRKHCQRPLEPSPLTPEMCRHARFRTGVGHGLLAPRPIETYGDLLETSPSHTLFLQ